MSEPENFVARWSRLKRETAKEADAAQAGPQPLDAGTEAAPTETAKVVPPEAGGAPEPAFDPATLPPIDSITASSDIRAFLQTGVPAELTRAALRRVWTTDPAIRDFIGIAENQWDFTDPTAMPGFGPLEATDDVRQLVADAMGRLGKVPEASVATAVSSEHAGPSAAASSPCAQSANNEGPQASGIPAESRPPDAGVADAASENNKVNVAVQHPPAKADKGTAGNHRVHGRALPQ